MLVREHGKVRESGVQKPMPLAPKSAKKKHDEEFELFVEMLRPVFLRTRLTDILKMPPYHYKKIHFRDDTCLSQ